MFQLLFLSLGFLVGVLLCPMLPYDLETPWVFLLVAPLLFYKPRIAFLLLGVILGFWRIAIYESHLPEWEAWNSWVELRGEIVEEVDRRQDHQKVTLGTEQGRVLVTLSPYVDVEFGDELLVAGMLEQPQEDEEFSYRNYLARYRITALMSRASLLEYRAAKVKPRRWIYQWKQAIEARLNRLFPEPDASFAAGLLLGSRKGMPDELSIAFQRTGLTHIIAISGYNISLVIAGMFLLLGFLALRTRIIVSCIAILLFVVFVGASAAVVRAGFMGIITLLGLFSGRKSQVYFALLWSAVLMIVLNPYTLAFDVGFQLSFASTLGLLLFSPILNERLPGKDGVLKEAFVLTLAAQIATLPLMMFHFGRVSLVSPLTNVLVAPFLPLAMFGSALSLIGGTPLALFTHVFLEAIQWIALSFNRLPYIEVPFALSAMGFALTLICGGISVFRFYKHKLAIALGLGREQALYEVLLQES